MSEQKETVFVDGLIVKSKHENAPDFIKCHLSLKVDELKRFLDEHQDKGWVNVDVKESKGGKLYAQLNDWKPEGKEDDRVPAVPDYPEDEINPKDVPF